MAELSENILRIKNKLLQLLKKYQALQIENETLNKKVIEFKISNQNQASRIHELQEQVNILKSATGQMNQIDKKIFEKHISQYIREIDKCIGLLSE